MVRKVSVSRRCDFGRYATGRHADSVELVAFSFDGSDYEIDLCASDAAVLRRQLRQLAAQGRPARHHRPSKRTRETRERAAEIRAYAKAQGYAVPDRGRLSTEVLDAWKQRPR